MPFILLAAGILLLVAGVRGKEHDLFALLKDDFIGAGGFIYWLIVLGILGGLGYFQTTRTLSRTMLALVLVAFVIAASKKMPLGSSIVQQTAASATTSTPTQINEVTAEGPTSTGSSTNLSGAASLLESLGSSLGGFLGGASSATAAAPGVVTAGSSLFGAIGTSGVAAAALAA